MHVTQKVDLHDMHYAELNAQCTPRQCTLGYFTALRDFSTAGSLCVALVEASDFHCTSRHIPNCAGYVTSVRRSYYHRRFHLVRFPAWWGFAGEGVRQRLGRLLSRMRRGGYLPSDFSTIESLVDEADRKLFKSTSQNRTHVLRHLFTVKPTPTRPFTSKGS